jgi:hypothetical protein
VLAATVAQATIEAGEQMEKDEIQRFAQATARVMPERQVYVHPLYTA